MRANEMTEIIGVTFPIPKKYMNRFFLDGKTVFIKPANCFKKIHPGMKFIFYQSHEDTGFIGEGKIVRISMEDDPLLFIEQFKDRIFLTPDEIMAYITQQGKWSGIRARRDKIKKKLWMAIELKAIKKYDQISKPARFVPVSGQYLRR